MKFSMFAACVAFFGFTVSTIQQAFGLNVSLDFDTNSFFYQNTTARAAIQQAADDVSFWITSSLEPIDQYEWSREDTIGGVPLTASFNYRFGYTAPYRMQSESPFLPADTVEFFVRGANRSQGRGIAAGRIAGMRFGARVSQLGHGIDPEEYEAWYTEVNQWQADAAAEEFDRGAGPVINTFDLGLLPFPVPYGPAFGALWFDTFGSAPSTDFYHIDHTTPVAPGKIDLYTVASKQILYGLGYGSSETWNDLVSGTSWTGSEVIAEHGTGEDLLPFFPPLPPHFPDGIPPYTVAEGVMSFSMVDGSPQEVLMDRTIAEGTRKFVTSLDLAFLRDLNYTTRIPEPSSSFLVAGIAIGFWLIKTKV